MDGSKALFAVAVTAMAGFGLASGAQAQSTAHIGHVAESWQDTPDGVGLLSAAQMEAEVAEQHAGLAAESEDLARIKAHIGHVMHALDPASVDGGPGHGYGVIKAASGAARHIEMAGEADDATEAAQAHSGHVNVAASNVASWAEAALEMGQQLQATDDLGTAQELAGQIHEATRAMLDGIDANGDGTIGWQEGEGGLAQATTHLGLIG